MKKYHLSKAASVVVVVLAVVIAAGLILDKTGLVKLPSPFNSLPNLIVSPDILYLTSPVYSLTGTVDKVEGNTIVVSMDTSTKTMMPPPNNAPSQLPAKKLTYRVNVPDGTEISKQILPMVINPVATTSSSSKLSMTDLKPGQIVSVSTLTDLRTLLIPTFAASRITLIPQTLSLYGSIVDLKANSLFVKPTSINIFSSDQKLDTNKIYEVEINPVTAIFSGAPLPLKNNKLSLSDLKKDMWVTVTSELELLSGNKLTAKIITVLPTVSLPGSTIPATGGAKTANP